MPGETKLMWSGKKLLKYNGGGYDVCARDKN